MKINILLPYKEKFDVNKASSVSITVKNNLNHSIFLKNIRVFGQNVDQPLFKNNFIGVKHSFFSFKSRNKFLADKMLTVIANTPEKKQIIEIHNRPYLVDQIIKKVNFLPISLFLHNDPKTMRGSKSIKQRENILKKCTLIFCVSEYIKNQFLDGVLDKDKKLHVLYNGVDRKLKKFPKKKKEVLFVGRLVHEKGVHLYTSVIKSIAIKYPEWNFGLIGSLKLGDNNNQNFFANKVINNFNSIGSQATFYGYKDTTFVEAKMKTASIIIIPSLWEEPFGLVAAEAMSNGIAIIASRSGGIPEIVQKNAILIDQINHSKLKIALEDLLKNNEKRTLFQKKSWNEFSFSSIKSSQELDEYRKMILKMQP